MGTVPFVDGVPDYEIRGGNMHISMGAWQMAMSLADFERGLAKSQRVIAQFRLAQIKSGEIVPLRQSR